MTTWGENAGPNEWANLEAQNGRMANCRFELYNSLDELIAYSDTDLSFSYKLTDGKPVGMQDYVVVAKIIPINSNKSEIRWSGKVESDKRLNEDDVAEALSVALNNMITGLIALIENQKPVFVHQPLEDWQKINK